MKYIKKFGSLKEKGINEGFWSSIFGRPSVKDASVSSVKGQGWSHTGRDEKEENYIIITIIYANKRTTTNGTVKLLHTIFNNQQSI